jgi:hypothetical protein
MEPALAELVAVDEELRARLSAAAAAARERTEAAAAARKLRDEDRQRAAQTELELEVRAILERGQRDISQRREARSRWLAERESAAAARLPQAAAVWAAIVGGP